MPNAAPLDIVSKKGMCTNLFYLKDKCVGSDPDLKNHRSLFQKYNCTISTICVSASAEQRHEDLRKAEKERIRFQVLPFSVICFYQSSY